MTLEETIRFIKQALENVNPDKRVHYTFADGRHACDMVYFNIGSPISSSITHWMPIPDMPKAEDEA